MYDTVRRLQQQRTVERKEGSGTMQRLGPLGVQHIVDFVAASGGRVTAALVAGDLAANGPAGEDIGRTQAHVYLRKRLDYDYNHARKTFVLTEEAMLHRQAWAVVHQHDQWDRTVFADEVCFQLEPNGRAKLWFPRRQRPIVEVHQYPRKLHALGAVSAIGVVGNLSFADTWNRHTFVGGVVTDILPMATAFYGNNWRLQLDNATAHTAGHTTAALLQAGLPEVLFQPAHSPDLNPIENVWGILKKQLATKRFQDIPQLRLAVQQMWQDLTVDKINCFTTSMPNRLQEVLTEGGGHTHY